MNPLRLVLVATITATLAAAAGCASAPESAAAPALPADAFYAQLKSLCGNAYAGRVVTDVPVTDGPNPFAGKPLVMHVRGCGQRELRVPFHVGEDRSRTWVVTRTDTGLRLKHDHRHEDGSDDAVTLYGGDTVSLGSSQRQEFPVDEYSKSMFLREGLEASVTNTWAMELKPGDVFVYELARPGGRLFQVEFDLTRPVAAPPAPWGDED